MKMVNWSMVALFLLSGPILRGEEGKEPGAAEPEPAGHAQVRIMVGRDGKVKVVESKDGPTLSAKNITISGRKLDLTAPAGGAWLGVSIRPVPPSLRAHLRLEPEAGVLVANIARSSPADEAGLQRYDVILAVDGEDVSDGPREFAAMLKDRSEGQKVQLALIRAGERLEQEVALAEAPTPEAIEYKEPPEELEVDDDRIRIRSHVLRRELDDLTPLIDRSSGGYSLELNDDALAAGEGEDVNLQVQVLIRDGEKKTIVKKVVDGESTEVETAADGKITVTRRAKGEDGQEKVTSTEYASVEQLEKEDPEAYELHSQTKQKTHTRVLRIPGGWGAQGGVKKFQFEVPDFSIEIPRAWTEKKLDDILEDIEIEPQLKELLESQNLEIEKLKKAAEVARRKIVQTWEPAWTDQESEKETEKVERHFEVQKDGSIRVAIRKNGSTVEITFESAEELEREEPKLFKHYKRLLDGE